MGLLPEFFMLSGIVIFLAMSLLSALLDDDLSSSLQYLFQVAAIVGLGLIFMSQGFINTGILGRDPTDIRRFSLSVVYLTSAVSSVIGLNAYLAVVRRKIALASIFSGTVTVPIVMISALFVSSFLGSGGAVSFTPTTMIVLAVSALVAGLSVFGFLREAFKHISNAPGGRGSSPTGPVSVSPGASGIGLQLHLPPIQGEEWEESPRKEEGGE
jgi:hypothetical protein